MMAKAFGAVISAMRHGLRHGAQGAWNWYLRWTEVQNWNQLKEPVALPVVATVSHDRPRRLACLLSLLWRKHTWLGPLPICPTQSTHTSHAR